jgi:hypothetical protein
MTWTEVKMKLTIHFQTSVRNTSHKRKKPLQRNNSNESQLSKGKLTKYAELQYSCYSTTYWERILLSETSLFPKCDCCVNNVSWFVHLQETWLGNNVSWFVHLQETWLGNNVSWFVHLQETWLGNNVTWFVHLQETWLGNNVSWFVHLQETWLGNNVPWFVHLQETWLGNNVPWFVHLQETWLGNNVSWFVHLQETWLGNNVSWFAHLQDISRKYLFPILTMAKVVGLSNAYCSCISGY